MNHNARTGPAVDRDANDAPVSIHMFNQLSSWHRINVLPAPLAHSCICRTEELFPGPMSRQSKILVRMNTKQARLVVGYLVPSHEFLLRLCNNCSCERGSNHCFEFAFSRGNLSAITLLELVHHTPWIIRKKTRQSIGYWKSRSMSGCIVEDLRHWNSVRAITANEKWSERML